MSKFSRSVLAVSAGVLLVGVSACAMPGESGDSEATEPSGEAQQAKALEGFDPCTFFQPEELQSWGVSTEGEEFEPVSFEPGCSWSGEELDITLQKNVEETVESYETGNWDTYERQQVGERPGAVAVVGGGTGNGVCNVLVDSGGGVAIYGVTGARADSVDACGESDKIASETASRLPE